MDTATIEYKQKVWQFLDKMKPGELHKIDRIAKPETRPDFIAAVKDYMDSQPWQGWLSFNADYTEIYKVHEIKFKNEGDKNTLDTGNDSPTEI